VRAFSKNELNLKDTSTQPSFSLAFTPEPVNTRIAVGRGILPNAGDLFAGFRSRRFLLISDAHVAPLYGNPLQQRLLQSGYRVEILIVPPGEGAKNLETLQHLYSACLNLNLDRDAIVVGIGGGVVGDLAGALAGTYMRGLELILVPTSLVAQVSASIGGKAAVNLNGYKNMIGLYKHPAWVVADLDTLATLPDEEFRSGLGELVTVGVLGAPEIFESLESEGLANLTRMVASAMICKAAIVQDDPLDRLDGRAKLNLGHTFGHALETLSGFRLAHGLAVAIGLHIATRLAAELGVCPWNLLDRILRVLRALNLPLKLGNFSADEVIEAMHRDKKKRANQLRFILPVKLGKVVLVEEKDLPSALLKEVLHELVERGDV
jgi:3-dehydroquinate synthase